MRLATIEVKGERRVAILSEDGASVRPLASGAAPSMLAAITAWAKLSAGIEAHLEAPVARETVRLLAPIPRPGRNIFCVGKNYHEHAKEFARSGFDSTAKEIVPEAPVVFSKPPSAVIGPGETILGSLDPTASVDYEGELAVVIGTGGRRIAKAEAMKHVFGYTIVNDVTARTLQQKHRQWLIGKGIDTFCPMGPAILTADAVADPARMTLKTWVNGELRQDALVADLIFDIPTLIETISSVIALEPGDVIATGTPVGVGIGFSPPKYLAAGDVVAIEIAGIGRLENPVA
ncbi:fumarylacetoacetate hydrolase family protein [Phreatobacter sp. AB_2022a]|uniref:fumarylacetoacetate hydrolase family protein n=1 Tax=Phreatobacter sp. AB_2022a TaxID=3003134 RepID=UPI002287161A|nr:fumarylacetoacetate hydrolase family protein [Phreatobacter sp. AB_2022a]MCZ0734668.1 fumarylacetoacetate hydrolase family protein [Phreatobacter sp. AB_2022a]